MNEIEEHITSNEFQDHKGNIVRYWKAEDYWICEVNKKSQFKNKHLINALIDAIQSISKKS